MRVNFRQGIVGHQSGSFLSINGSGHVDLLAANKPVTLNLAHKSTNYIHSEDNTVSNAWLGPFTAPNYWLYVDFNQQTFTRTFGTTTLEPVAQSAEPGTGDAQIFSAVAGNPGIGMFQVPEHYVLAVGREFTVTGSTANDGVYTVASATFDGGTGRTTITVGEIIPDSTADGELTLDVDSIGVPLLTTGRHWYDTSSDIHYVYNGALWTKVLRVFIAGLTGGNTFISHSLNAPLYTGTQIGNVESVLSGRVLFDETSQPQLRDDGTFLTTEDQFFTNQSRVDGIRLESNVSKAQNAAATLASFTVVAYDSDGKIQAAQYNDTGATVIGMLTEGLANGEVGSVILQGVITNVDWNWLSFTNVGQELWVENGLLVFVDPHVSNPVTYTVGQVPVARVLSNDTIIFEQGLGGKGDKGPTGSVANLPPATTVDIGGCTLVTASSDPAQAFVISDTDSRLADSRNPLPHSHNAVDITFVPGSGVSSNNLQLAVEEVSLEKLAIAGGTMTGFLTLNANPSTALHAASKQYVDNLVSGLVWLDPVELVHLISDVIDTPPTAPINPGDAYIIPAGGGTGAWAAIPAENVVSWNGTVWVDHGFVGGFHGTEDSRFIIGSNSPETPSGTFTGRRNEIVSYNTSGVITGYVVPADNNAVYVHYEGSIHAFNQYAFDGTNWVLFSSGQNLSADGTTIDVTANVISVIPWASGGTVDAEKWQDMIPSDLDSVYAASAHTHSGSTITALAYNTSPDWGTLTNTSDEIVSLLMQTAMEDITDNKAAKMPTYATQAHRPVAANVDGMIAYVQDVETAYIASNGAWVPLVKENDTIRLPYDLAFYIAGGMQEDHLTGSFMITRPVTIKTGAPDSIAYAQNTATDGTYTLDLVHKPVGTSYTPIIVGTIAFSVGVPLGVITWGSDVSFVAGDLLQIQTQAGTPDTNLEDLSITIVGCAPTQQCTV